MDFIDYRKALGISFCAKDKNDLFIKRVGVYMQSEESIPFEEKDEIDLSYMIGEEYLLADINPFDIKMGNDPIGLQRAWLYLSKHTDSFEDFLSCLVALINTYGGKKSDKKDILSNVKKALNDSHIEFELIEDTDGVFIFPKGAKELDDALVSAPLEWLRYYPNSRKEWISALKDYANLTDDKASDVADKFRKALERFLQEFFGKTKSLENLKSEYGAYLKARGVPSEISNNFETLQKSYTDFMNNYAKHHNKTSRNVLEYIMYQTGNIIRLLITLKQEENNDVDLYTRDK